MEKGLATDLARMPVVMLMCSVGGVGNEDLSSSQCFWEKFGRFFSFSLLDVMGLVNDGEAVEGGEGDA